MSRTQATLTGFVAILLWSLLAVLTVGAMPVPPFLLNAVTFGIGGLVGLVWITLTGRWGDLSGLEWRALVFGTAGLFGYHALYFSALRLAPPAEAGLINYLWPLLIVLLSGLLPGERLRTGTIIGAALAFGGAALIVLAQDGGARGADANLGLLLALLAAVTWALYSTGLRRFGQVPTAAVALCCLATAVLSIPLHLMWETTFWPSAPQGWLAVVALGLGPVGLAFYVWDIGMKRGDIQLLGVASYAAPLLSTLVLILAGVTQPRPVLALAALLIALGAAWAAIAGRKGR